MTSPILPFVETITQDRIRDAENARLARSAVPEQPQRPPRRIRTLAARLSLVTR
jgi:hypothetical protein